jgi:predicted nucleic acid-binding protein
VITLDTSGIVASLNADDPYHHRAQQALAGERGRLIVPIAIVGEVGYMIEKVLGVGVLRQFVSDIHAGFYKADCGEADFDRVADLLDRYADLCLGVADACVIACAERNGGRVLTFDVRDFAPVAREGAITIVPAAG